jgi:hypothetical protein
MRRVRLSFIQHATPEHVVLIRTLSAFTKFHLKALQGNFQVISANFTVCDGKKFASTGHTLYFKVSRQTTNRD